MPIKIVNASHANQFVRHAQTKIHAQAAKQNQLFLSYIKVHALETVLFLSVL
jgi:hypothetical protein